MPYGFVCQKCGVEAPSKYVEFYYNIGALVVRYHKAVKGNLCKRCIHKTFWNFTLIDVTAGWWGTLSFFITPCFLVNNIVRYAGAIGLPATPANAATPVLTQEAVSRIAKYQEALIERLNKKEPLNGVLESIARSAGVTPGQVLVYIRAITQPRTPAVAPPGGAAQTRAFPVMPVAPMPAIPLNPPPDDPQQSPPPKPNQADLMRDIGL